MNKQNEKRNETNTCSNFWAKAIFKAGIITAICYPAKQSIAKPILITNETIFSQHETMKFGTKRSKRWYLQGAFATTLDNEESRPRRFGLMGAGLSKFFANGHSVNLELNTIYFNQPEPNAVGVNLALIMRWHFVRNVNYSLYLDSGAGVMGTTNNVPSGGSSFNFTPQLGIGTTIGLKNDKRLLLGLRWHHISHADLMNTGNPGRDSIMGYVGLSYPR